MNPLSPLAESLSRPNRLPVLEHNARAWDRLAQAQGALAQPAVDEAFDDPRAWLGSGGTVGRRWLPERLAGLEVLCLAAGGGKHGPLYAAAGARVTVVDLSPAMLELDRQVARERGLNLNLIAGSMDALGMLPQGRFDLVIHPVSTCYLPEVRGVFREVARVTRPGGIYVSQHKSPASLQSSAEPGGSSFYELRHPQSCQTPLPPTPPSRLRETGTQEFIHSLSDLFGGICAAGFILEDVCEPHHARGGAAPGSFAHRATFLPPYLRILARRLPAEGGSPWRPDAPAPPPEQARLWGAEDSLTPG